MQQQPTGRAGEAYNAKKNQKDGRTKHFLFLFVFYSRVLLCTMNRYWWNIKSVKCSIQSTHFVYAMKPYRGFEESGILGWSNPTWDREENG